MSNVFSSSTSVVKSLIYPGKASTSPIVKLPICPPVATIVPVNVPLVALTVPSK
jgi:hypothetical protein